jgi:hypothetical protein
MTSFFERIPPRDGKTRLVNVIIDTPRGRRNKFKFDEELGCFRLSRTLPAGHSFCAHAHVLGTGVDFTSRAPARRRGEDERGRGAGARTGGIARQSDVMSLPSSVIVRT